MCSIYSVLFYPCTDRIIYTFSHSFTVDYISAGDIEKYSYCPLSWWLSREEKNIESEGVHRHRDFSKKAIDGMHEIHGERDAERNVMYLAMGATVVAIVGISMFYSSYSLAITFHIIAIFWLSAAMFFLWKSDRYALLWKDTFVKMMLILPLAATVFSILAVSFIMAPDFKLGYTLEILSILWLILATFYFYIAIKKEFKYSEIRKELQLPDGEIIYVDDLEKSPLLKSERYGIWGRPDLLIKIGDEYVPVEIKTGRIPKGPLFSHIMQLTAYMVLVEENYGHTPYGLLKYGPQVFKIEYEEDLKEIMLKKVEEMRRAMKTGEVHRNHHRPGKCRHCSRRDICPERLA